ncbi:hypothetical protein BD769DRAFT_1388548 [Suillus cothurnatus]|nr:hypothetical protein BD769DRAFT_1388548 [Suillus cothurnatus]
MNNHVIDRCKTSRLLPTLANRWLPLVLQPGYYGHQHDGQAQASGSGLYQTHLLPPTNNPIYRDDNSYDPSTNPYAAMAVMLMTLPWHIPSYPQVQVPLHLLGYDQPPADYQFYENINHSSLPTSLQMPSFGMPPSPTHPPNHEKLMFDVLHPPFNTVNNPFELEAPAFIHPLDDQVPETHDDSMNIGPMRSHIVSVQPCYPLPGLSAFLPEFTQLIIETSLFESPSWVQKTLKTTQHFAIIEGRATSKEGRGRSAKRAIMKHTLNVTALTEEGDRVMLATKKLKEAAQKRMGEKQGAEWVSHNSGMLYMVLSEPCKSIMQTCRKHADNLVVDGFGLHLSIWSDASESAHQETLITHLLDDQTFPPKFVMRLDKDNERYFLENEVMLNVMLNTIRELALSQYVEELDSLACIAAVAVRCALEKVKYRISADVEFSGATSTFKGLYNKLMDYIEGMIKKCPRLQE